MRGIRRAGHGHRASSRARGLSRKRGNRINSTHVLFAPHDNHILFQIRTIVFQYCVNYKFLGSVVKKKRCGHFMIRVWVHLLFYSSFIPTGNYGSFRGKFIYTFVYCLEIANYLNLKLGMRSNLLEQNICHLKILTT